MRPFAKAPLFALLLTLLLPALVLCQTPWLELSGSNGVIGQDAFSGDVGFRSAAGVYLFPELSFGIGYERLSGQFNVNSTFVFLEKDRSFDVFTIFVEARLMERPGFSLWHGLAWGRQENGSSIAYQLYGAEPEDDPLNGLEDVDDSGPVLETWLRGSVRITDRIHANLGSGARLLGVRDLTVPEESALSGAGVGVSGAEEGGALRVFFRLGLEYRL